MELNPELRDQLMALTGMTDVDAFNQMVRDIAPTAVAATTGEGGQHSSVLAKRSCPFQVHFVRMLALLETAGQAKFSALNDDIPAQIRHTFDVINQEEEYRDVRNLLQKRSDDASADLAECSKTLRDRGNKCYQKKAFAAALEEYCHSILGAPVVGAEGGGKEVSLGIGNRSAVFFETGQYRKCLDDIEAALMFGYPTELRYKLHDREARCHLALGDGGRAREAFQKALDAVEKSNMKLNKKNEFRAETLQAIDNVDCCSGTSAKSTLAEDSCPYRIWDRHVNFPPLSDSLDIVFSEEVGRHVVARKSIRAGEAIVIEDPIVAHLSPYKMPTNCLHCFRRNSTSVLPSPLQRKARFCSLACLRVAMDTYHPVESKVDITDIFYSERQESQLSGCISLAYRALTQKNLNFFKKRRNTLFSGHDIKFGTNIDKAFSYSGEQHYRGLYNLVTHYDKSSAQLRMTFMIRTVVLLNCLRAAGYFPEEVLGRSKLGAELTDDEVYVAELLFHFQSGIQYNLHTVYQVEDKIEAAKKIPMIDIGAGVYPTTIFFNHSCCPNTVRINQGPRVIFVAKRNIACGEEVTDCYGIHHLSMDTKIRRDELKTGYAFDCKCQGCLKELPLLSELPTTISATVAVKLGTMLSKYKSLFEEGKIDKALKMCQDYLMKLEEVGVTFPHRNYEIGAMALCTCLWKLVQDV